MAQPLPQTAPTHADFNALSGIDEAAARLEQAFRRLEAATEKVHTGHASLKAEKEKLNHLLEESGRDVAKMRDAVRHVTGRLDHTIAVLEAMEQ